MAATYPWMRGTVDKAAIHKKSNQDCHEVHLIPHATFWRKIPTAANYLSSLII